MHVLRGATALSYIVLTVFFACLLVFVLTLFLLLCPSRKVRHATRGFMDRMINIWVAGNRWMVNTTKLISIETNFDQEIQDKTNWHIMICNHQSWADIIVLQIALLDIAPPIKFFTKRELRWIPLVGVALWILKFPYVIRISRDEGRKNPTLYQRNVRSMNRAKQQFNERPVSILTFCEGTRYDQAKHRAQRSPYRNLLRPKVGGVSFSVESLRDKTDLISDVTLVYKGKVPNFWAFLCGTCKRAKIHARSVPIAELAQPNLKTGVHNLWQGKDELIDRLQQEF